MVVVPAGIQMCTMVMAESNPGHEPQRATFANHGTQAASLRQPATSGSGQISCKGHAAQVLSGVSPLLKREVVAQAHRHHRSNTLVWSHGEGRSGRLGPATAANSTQCSQQLAWRTRWDTKGNAHQEGNTAQGAPLHASSTHGGTPRAMFTPVGNNASRHRHGRQERAASTGGVGAPARHRRGMDGVA